MIEFNFVERIVWKIQNLQSLSGGFLQYKWLPHCNCRAKRRLSTNFLSDLLERWFWKVINCMFTVLNDLFQNLKYFFMKLKKKLSKAFNNNLWYMFLKAIKKEYATIYVLPFLHFYFFERKFMTETCINHTGTRFFFLAKICYILSCCFSWGFVFYFLMGYSFCCIVGWMSLSTSVYTCEV